MIREENSLKKNVAIPEVLAADVDSGATRRFASIPAEGEFKIIEDPMANFLRDKWRALVIFIAIGAAIFYAVGVYRSTQLTAQQSSGDSFVGLQRTFSQLQELNEKAPETDAKLIEQRATEKAELEKRFESQVKSLSFANAPYANLSAVYQTLNQIKSPDGKNIRTQILTEARFLNTTTAAGLDKVTQELLYFAAARAEIDIDVNAARAALLKLADHGEYAAGSSVKTLIKIADSDETRAAAIVAEEKLLARKPELSADLIEKN